MKILSFRKLGRSLMIILPLAMLFGCQRSVDKEEMNQAIEAYLEKNGLDFLDKNLTALVEKREEEARLKEQDTIIEAYRNRVKGSISETTPLMGVKDAELEVVIFGNFQDPFTKISYTMLKDFVEGEFKENAKLGFRHLPNDRYEYSRMAAAAGEAARRQGKFWEMADLLFETQDNLKDGSLQNAARSIGLDLKKFNEDRASVAVKKVIEADEKFAHKNGAIVTPTYFVNGAAFFGARKERRMKHIFKTLLKVRRGEIKVSERYE